MSGDVMMFPDTVEEFMEQYKVVDREQVYSNGIEFVPIFRMQQWFDHVKHSPDDVRPVGKWIRQEKSHPNCPEDSDYRYECSVCGWSDQHNAKMIVPFCWHCGARMKGADDGTTE